MRQDKPLRLFILSGFLSLILSAGGALAETDSVYARRISRESGRMVYVVGPRAPHLYMISRDLYGTEARWKDLAKWNELKAPYALEDGQRLVIRLAPTQSDAEANRLLVREWTRQGEIERARRIAILQLQSESEVAEAEAEVPVPAEAPETLSVVLKAETSANVVTEVLLPEPPAPPLDPLPEPLPPEPVLAPMPEPPPMARPPQRRTLPVEARPKAAGHPSHWHLSVKALAAVTEAMNNDLDSGIRNTLTTHVDPGFEIEAEWAFSPRSFLTGAVSFETFEVHAPHGAVEPAQLGLWRFTAGYGSRVAPWLDFSLSGALEQMAVSRPTLAGADLGRAEIPQLVLGSRWLLSGGPGRVKVHALLSLLALFPDKVFHYDLKAGTGAAVGLQLTHAGGLTYGITGRAVEQNADNLKSQQTTGVLNIGWCW